MGRDSRGDVHPEDGGGVSEAYIDTHYFLSIVYDEGDSQDARLLLSQLDNNAYRVLVPQIILGEIVAKILKKSDANSLRNDLGKLGEIFFKYKISVYECLPGTSKNTPRIMLDMQNLDERLTPNDTIILSEVLADPDSKFFFTRDSNILENLKIKNYERSMFESGSRNTHLKIRGSLQNT